MADLGQARDILDALADAVTIRGRDDRLVYANRAALRMLGFASSEELSQADPAGLLGPYEIEDEHGRPLGIGDLPSVRLLRGEEPEPLLLHSVRRASGEETWVVLKATALRDENGEVEAAVTIIEDVSAARRATLRLEFLARAGQILASSLDYQQTLRNVAMLAVPQIADWCGVDLFEAGMRVPVAVAHTDPAKLDLAERLRSFEPVELQPERGLGRLARTGEPILVPEVPDEALVAAAVSEEHLRVLREIAFRSVLLLPLTARGRVIGAITMVTAESGRLLGEDDLRFGQEIAERAALAVENARLYTERADVARTLQRSLLPAKLPRIPAWEVATLYRAAGQGNEVGGDFYDFWLTGGEWLMMIGDVAGKGVDAAAVTSLVRHTARASSDFDARPGKILERVDAALKESASPAVCTALCLRLAGGHVTAASGGHPLPLHLSTRGVEEVGRHGTLLGPFRRVSLPEAAFTLEVGEALVAITDGVTDTVGRDGERFGSQRLVSVLEGLRNASPMAIRAAVAAALDEFQVGVPADDTAVVVMRFSGTREATGHKAAGAEVAGAPST